MQQLIEFATNHWILVLSLLTISGLLVYNLTLGAPKDQLDPQAVTELINHRNALVVDVRPVADFSQGHIINAVNLPMNSFQNQLFLATLEQIGVGFAHNLQLLSLISKE